MARPRAQVKYGDYRTPQGVRRRVRLREVWLNLNGRLKGGKSASAPIYWAGKGCEFVDWGHFRSWALASGYRRGVELDRIESSGPYAPYNCQWLEKVPHAVKTRAGHTVECRCASCYRLIRVTARDADHVPF